MRYLIAVAILVLLSPMFTTTAGWCAEDLKKEFDFANPNLPVRDVAIGSDDANHLTHEYQ